MRHYDEIPYETRNRFELSFKLNFQELPQNSVMLIYLSADGHGMENKHIDGKTSFPLIAKANS